MLSDFVSVHPQYVRSANLERDFQSEEFPYYAPTPRVLDLLARFCESVENPKLPRAWSITGPYGSGKSSFANFLVSLLGAEETTRRKQAWKVLRQFDPVLARRLAKATKSLAPTGRGFIPAIVTASQEPITATIRNALLAGIEAYWKRRVPQAVSNWACSVEEGVPSPVEASDGLRILSEYAPVLLLIDEMGKPLEFAASKADTTTDLYLLQVLAEAISGNSVGHAFLFTLQHLALSDYGQNLPVAQLQEWTKIQGRFEDVSFTEAPTHLLEIISRSIALNPEYGRKVIPTWRQANESVLKSLEILPPETRSQLLENTYPLHPVSLAILPELCSRFGQHDRSLFTFMSSNEHFSFLWFLDQSGEGKGTADCLRPALLYDYFVGEAGMVSAASDDTSRWLEIQATVREVGHALSQRELDVLKTVAVLNLVGPANGTRASLATVEYAVDGPAFSKKGRERAPQVVAGLLQRGLLVHRDFVDELRVWKGSDFDIGGALRKERERNSNLDVPEHLSRAARLVPLVARRHSVQTGTLRYFERRYVDSLDSDVISCADSTADGLILYLVSEKAPSSVPGTTVEGKPLVVIHVSNALQLREPALEVVATQRLLESSSELSMDPVARREVRHRANEAHELMRSRLDLVLDPSHPGTTYYVQGKPKSRRGSWTLSQLLSELCDSAYSQAPILRNEMLNRRELTSQGAKTRRELLEKMVTHGDKVRLGIEGYGPDRSMYESVLASTGIHRRRSGVLSFMAPDEVSGLRPVWEQVNRFFDAATSSRSRVGDLYAELMSPPFGMKEGSIPVLLIAALLHRSEDVALYQEGTFQALLTPDVVERLIKIPDRFEVKKFEIRGVRRDVFRALQDQLIKDESSKILRNQSLVSIARPLFSLVKALPEYARRTKRLSSYAIQVRDSLSSSQELDELLFSQLPRAVGVNGFSPSDASRKREVELYCSRLQEATLELQSTYEDLLSDVESGLAASLGGSGTGSELREDIRTRSKHLVGQVIEPRLRSFLLMAANTDLDDRDWLEALAMNINEKPPKTWTDDDVSRFEAKLHELSQRFKRVELLHYGMLQPGASTYETRRIAVTRPEGYEASSIAWIDHENVQVVRDLAMTLLSQIDDTLGAEHRLATLALLSEEILRLQESEQSPTIKEATNDS